MWIVGVDLASQPENSSVCMLEWTERPRVHDVTRPADDDMIQERARSAGALGIDSPFGWPTPFVEIVTRHHRGLGTLDVDATPRELRLRATDLATRELVGRDPLSVSTDRLGIVALRCIGILERLRGPGLDRSGAAGIYEAYPGGALARWGLPSTGYKGTGARSEAAIGRRRAIVDALADLVDLGGTEERLVAHHDDLDAVITALVTGLAHAGRTVPPPPELRELATTEGWIHVPMGPIEEIGRPLSALEG